MPPGAFVNSQESKNMYAGLLRPTPFNIDESKGLRPRIQLSWSAEKAAIFFWDSGSPENCFSTRWAAVAKEASRAFSPCHQGAASLLCGKKKLVRRFPVLSCTNWR